MKETKAGPKGPATPRRVGRPSTRTRTALLWAVWRLVREEIAYRGAPNALQACASIIARAGVIRIDGLTTTNIAGANTLHRWYRTAESARATSDAELSARCAAWEVAATARWPDRVATEAFWSSMQASERAGLLLTQQWDTAQARAMDAADRARARAAAMPRPRKNRR